MSLAVMMVASAIHAKPVFPNRIQALIYDKCRSTYSEARSLEKAAYYAPIIRAKAHKYHLDPLLLASVVWHESNFNPREVSSGGALGLGQVIPQHFKSHGYSVREWKDPEVNLDVAADLLSWYRGRVERRYPGLNESSILHRTLVSYNLGPLAVKEGVHRNRYSAAIIKDVRRWE